MGLFTGITEGIANTVKGVVCGGIDLVKGMANCVAAPLDMITAPFQNVIGGLAAGGLAGGAMMGNMMNPFMNNFMQNPMSAMCGGPMGGMMGMMGQMNPSMAMLGGMANNMSGLMGGLNPLNPMHSGLNNFLPNIQNNLMNSFAYGQAHSFDYNVHMSPMGSSISMNNY